MIEDMIQILIDELGEKVAKPYAEFLIDCDTEGMHPSTIASLLRVRADHATYGPTRDVLWHLAEECDRVSRH